MLLTKNEYQEYLQTDHWIDFSQEIKAQRPCCERCGCDRKNSLARFKQGLHVHHKTYERIGRELPDDVEVLCFSCHLADEHDSDDPTVSWKAIAARFAMPAVAPIETHFVCVNCGKPIRHSPIYNFDELATIDTLCRECS
jgi:hypothetical protein